MTTKAAGFVAEKPGES